MNKSNTRQGMLRVKGAIAGELTTEAEVDKIAESSTAKGDSGGPLFAGDPWQIVGVTSGGVEKDGRLWSHFVNVNDPHIRAFLEKVLQTNALAKLMDPQLSQADYASLCQTTPPAS